jgi:hypothetical protein
MHKPALVLALVTGVAAASPPAHACGGLFCDNGPQPMPVDQTGENILFVMTGGTVEAHIQIQYQGEAERFSWVIPVTAVPEFSVGSQLLFNELLRYSVPRYQTFLNPDSCGVNLNPGWGGTGGTASEDVLAPNSRGGETGPVVVSKKQVGAFDITVLSTGSAAELMTWLSANNYVQLPGTEQIVTQYVAENHLFAAVKLVNGAGVDEIHPLVMKYAGNLPCVPLKLTAVAAQQDMGVRTFFLGDGRVVPRHYKHLEVNPVRIDWVNNAQNYREVLSNAANDPVAGGQAFVTEYAGPLGNNGATFFNESAFYSAAWDGLVFVTLPVEQVVDVLAGQGLVDCLSNSSGECTYNHPLVQGLLNQYLPVPSGMDEVSFYGALRRNAAQINRAAWDGAAFSVDLDTRVVQPGVHARDLTRTNTYLTRLFTLISPEEMTVDPEFHERADLPDVDVLRTATLATRCDGQAEMTLADGQTVFLRDATTWPTFPASMPWALKVQDIPEVGETVTLLDNTQAVSTQLSQFNDSQRGSVWCACTQVPRVPVTAGFVVWGLLLGLMRGRRGRG